MKRLLTVAVVAALFTGGVVGAQTTRPNERNRRAAAGGEAALFDRLQERLAELNLTDDQKKQIESLKDSVAETVRGMAGELKEMTPDERREKIREAVNAREKLMAILTPEQRAKLRGPGNRRAATSRPTESSPARQPQTKPAESPAARAVPSAASQPAVGQPAPAFTLRRLNGNEATNKTFTGKPLVLVFGSLTSPSFRDRVPKLLDLKKKYASRANVLVVYTREAHPSDGWQVERNRDDKVVFPKPTTDAERMTLAKQLRDRFGPELDVLVDDLNDTTLAAFGNNADGAVVLAPYGQVVGTQKFADVSGLPRLIDEALKTR